MIETFFLVLGCVGLACLTVLAILLTALLAKSLVNEIKNVGSDRWWY